jgi:hypothetical protein
MVSQMVAHNEVAFAWSFRMLSKPIGSNEPLDDNQQNAKDNPQVDNTNASLPVVHDAHKSMLILCLPLIANSCTLSLGRHHISTSTTPWTPPLLNFSHSTRWENTISMAALTNKFPSTLRPWIQWLATSQTCPWGCCRRPEICVPQHTKQSNNTMVLSLTRAEYTFTILARINQALSFLRLSSKYEGSSLFTS